MAGHALIGPAHLTADSVMTAVFLDVQYLPDLIRSIGKKKAGCPASAKNAWVSIAPMAKPRKPPHDWTGCEHP